MKEEFKVSVYIPTHNRACLLKKAVLSVVNQTYKNIEIIIVDDGSSDNTPTTLKKLTENYSNIKVLTNTSPKGAAYSRNLAIKHSSGTFITGLDDDDSFASSRIKDFISNWNNQYGLLFSNYVEITDLTRTKNLPRKSVVNFSDMKKRNYIGNQVFTTKTNYIQVGGFDEKLEAWEDYDLWFRLIAAYGPAKVVNNHSYLLNVDNIRPRITNSSNIMLACDQFISKHHKHLSDIEINYLKVSAIKDSQQKLPIKQSLHYCKDIYSTIQIFKANILMQKHPSIKLLIKSMTSLLNYLSKK